MRLRRNRCYALKDIYNISDAMSSLENQPCLWLTLCGESNFWP